MVLLCTASFKHSLVGGIFVITVDSRHLVRAQEGKMNFVRGFSSRPKEGHPRAIDYSVLTSLEPTSSL